jgi:vacuolar-type H+-ATPase subunit H
MELIKKIKQSEAQAQEIVAQARADAAAMADQQRKDHQKSMEQAEHERKKAIDAAVARATTEGQTETEQLGAKAQQDLKALREKTKPAIAGAVGKVVDFLKG